MKCHNKIIAGILIILLLVSIAPSPPGALAADAPQISSVSPAQGPNTGGTTVTIFGSNFVAGDVQNTKVYFGPATAVVQEVRSDRVIVSSPAYASAGAVDVKVVNPDGISDVMYDGFLYTSTPTIDADPSPNSGTSIGGTRITITGTEFQPGAKVYVDNNLAEDVIVDSATQIKATTPPGTLGYKTVQVVNPDGGTASRDNAFNYVLSTPAVESISPTKGAGGTVITVTGAVYSEFGVGAKVKVGINYASNVQVISPREITAVVPPGNVDGTKKDIQVINPDGASSTLSGAFEYIIMPSVTSITPNYGWTGDTIIIKGANFGKIFQDPDTKPMVVVGGFAARVDSFTADTITATLLDGNVGPADVTVRNPADPEQGVTVPSGFTFTQGKSQPVVTIIEPNMGSTDGGQEVTITGSDFRIAADGALPVVLVGGKQAEIKRDFNGAPYVEPTRIVIITPSHSAGPKDVTVTNPDGGTVTVKDGFTYKIPERVLRITSVTPDKGTVEGGTPITVFGVNFPTVEEWQSVSAQVYLYIGGNPATNVQVTKIDDTTVITAETPGGYVEEGQLETSQDVMLEVVRGTTVERYTLVGGFTYRMPGSQPRISAVKNTDTGDNTGPLGGGSQISITGTDFRSGVSVYIGRIDVSRRVQVLSVTTTEIRAVTPAGDKPGPVDVIVINADLGMDVAKNAFVYKGTTMVVTSVTPNFGPVSGGTRIEITGANFDEDTIVRDDGSTETYIWLYLADAESRYQAEIVRRDDGKLTDGFVITAITPKYTPGLKDVIVANRYGEYVLPLAFDYRLPSVNPMISMVTSDEGTPETPARGPVTGGTPFTIEGMNFASGATVTVGGQPATDVVVQSSTLITAVSPPGQPGLQDVTVTNAIGGSHTMPGGFFYYSNPAITGTSPATGSIYGGSIVSISGRQFYPGAQVVVGSVYLDPEKDVFVAGQDLMKIRLPAEPTGKEGPVMITITNTDGGSTSWDKFIYKKPAGTVTVNQVDPQIGPTEGGTEVTIKGDGFAPDAMVYFGWEQAVQVKVISPREIQAVTPPNLPGFYDVTVVNKDDTGAGVLPAAFKYRLPLTSPKITGVYPNFGPDSGDTPVVIKGENFWPGAQVRIGDNLATGVKVVDSKTIEAFTPAGPVGPVNVQVINPDGGLYLLKNGFTYKKPASSPTIQSIAPAFVTTAGGTYVTVSGSDFRLNARVFFGAVESGSVELLDGNTLRVKTPPHAEGTYNVTVVNEDGGTATLFNGITYLYPQSEPRITAINPNSGVAAGGTEVTITGFDFRPGAEVYFNGVAATGVVVVDYTTIIARTPPGKKGPADVTVMNTGADLGSFTLRNGFTYVTSAPKITAVLPNMGTRAGGDQVTITGQDFLPGAKVYIGDDEAPVISVQSTAITFITPASENIGPRDVKVVNPDLEQAVLKNGFTYKIPDSNPLITGVDPGTGSTAGGIYVTITGQDFRDGALVYIGGREATEVKILDGGRAVKARTPPHTAGPKDVTVINYDGGSHTLPGGFTYQVPGSEPVIKSVTPGKGPIVGGTLITVTGLDFREGIAVFVGGSPATGVERVDYKTLKATVPPGEQGPAGVSVVNPDQGSFTLAKGFTYYHVEIPVITSVLPGEGPTTGGTAITISGDRFIKGATVTIGGKPALNVQVVDKNRITAVTPAGPEGWQELKITNPDGGWSVLANGFRYVRPRSKPDTPGWLSASSYDHQTIRLRWDPVEFANYYEIYVSPSNSTTYRFLAQTRETLYYATDLEPDEKYYFQVRAVNELGVSYFSDYDYVWTKEEDDDDRKQETVPYTSITNSGGQVTVHIPTEEAFKSGYRWDLDEPEFRQAKKFQVTLAGRAAKNGSRNLVVDTGIFRLVLSSGALRTPTIASLSSSELDDSWVRLTVTDLGQGEAESALGLLPKGSRILSPVLAVGWESQTGRKVQQVDRFYGDVTLDLSYNPDSLRQPERKKIDIYVYNPGERKWQALGGDVDPYWPTVSVVIKQPGRYVLVEQP
ncbi:hypothetical protein SY88_04290 [Clostridiales bacterium PH28_bin88]|nr:hypothetical protein SY88_04290 [Clostridiales bacterium PH28_bin88]